MVGGCGVVGYFFWGYYYRFCCLVAFKFALGLLRCGGLVLLNWLALSLWLLGGLAIVGLV